MNDGRWPIIDDLTANAAGYLIDHPRLSQGAIAVTLAAGCCVTVAAPSWARSVCSDRSLRKVLRVCGVAAGGCMFLTGLLYESLLDGLDGVITFVPLMFVYYPASIVLSCAAMVFALSVPVYQFALILGFDR